MLRRLLLPLLLLAAQWCAAAPAFAPVTPGQPLAFPRDYGAHPAFKTEWWYVTGWLKTTSGKPLGFQVTFFRSATGLARHNPSRFAARQLVIGHAALSDPATGRLLHDQRSAREGFGLAQARVGDTDIRLDGWTMQRGADGAYRVRLRAREFNLDLRLTPTQPVLVQGEGGFSRKGPNPAQASYYYSEPHLAVSGSTSRGAVSGTAWLDHEWSSEALDPDAAGWDWVGLNLDDGSALMAFQIRSKQGGKLWAHATLRDAAGRVSRFAPGEVVFTPRAHWRSPRTNAEYPVATELRTGSATWQIKPLQDDQELDSRRSTGAVYWEGAVTVEREGRRAGQGYLEMTGYVDPIQL
ncbi:lipocalin-like domain-containing protein [Pseudoduganella sp. GCM10020061]|uniref:lipocalin-like domain-containing protein n=1 Tax=Pseudoduganella sp. GCM10020061 TaxID=3317345 RepID=UPI00364236FC